MEIYRRTVFLTLCTLIALFSMGCSRHPHAGLHRLPRNPEVHNFDKNIEGCLRPGLKKDYIRAFQNTCYYFETFWKRTFSQAETFCKSIGGSLAMLKTKAVNDFAFKQLRHSFKVPFDFAYFWIGLDDRHRESRYTWADGSPMVYSNFDVAQGPYNTFGHWMEDCIVINGWNGKWRDLPCSYIALIPVLRPFICQYSKHYKIPTTTTTTTTTTATTTTSTTTSTTTTPQTTACTTTATTVTLKADTTTMRPTAKRIIRPIEPKSKVVSIVKFDNQ